MVESRRDFSLTGEAATEALGAALARAYAESGRGTGVVFFHGELGTGKTTCVRRLLRTLGVAGSIRSPTYTLVEVYETGVLTGVHVDLYRLQSALEVDELGLRDYLAGDCLLLVEWPERGGRALPDADLDVMLTYAGDGRRATLVAASELGRTWLALLSQDNSLLPYVINIT